MGDIELTPHVNGVEQKSIAENKERVDMVWIYGGANQLIEVGFVLFFCPPAFCIKNEEDQEEKTTKNDFIQKYS